VGVQSPDVEATTCPTLTDELRAKVAALIDDAVMIDIRPSEIKANIGEGVAPGAAVDSISVEVAVAFALGQGAYGNRFEFAFTLLGEVEDEPIGHVGFTLLIDYRVSNNFAPDQETAEYFAVTTGYFAAYPYARELFQSLAGRLQFDPLVLGMIKRGSVAPGSVNVLRVRTQVQKRSAE
jgi:hypothetical protein